MKKIFRLLPFLSLLFLPFILANFKEVKKYFTRAFYQKANIVVDSTDVRPNYITNWLSFAQGGEEPGKNMIMPIQKNVQNLNPQYIRIDHIFDDAFYQVVQTDGASQWYDFSRLDQTVDSILKTGAKPMLVLSYMPQSFAPNLIDTPYDWTEWQKLVQTTIQHYSGIKEKNISHVYYEVWNEPDLESFGDFDYYGEKNYLDLYYYSAMAAKNTSGCQHFKIGGPATTNLYQRWVEALLEFSQENNLPLGFISYHQYSMYPEEYQNNVNALKNWLEKYPKYKNINVVLSEWGPDSEANMIYNNQISAAFTLANISEIKDGVDLAFAFELKDGPDEKKWGLIGHENQQLWLKPRYHIFNWLSNIKDVLFSSGNGTFVKAVAGKNQEKTILILSNYDPNNKHQEEVPIKITNLKPGSYRLKKQFLEKKPIYEYIEINTDTYKTYLLFPPNSVYLLELEMVQ